MTVVHPQFAVTVLSAFLLSGCARSGESVCRTWVDPDRSGKAIDPDDDRPAFTTDSLAQLRLSI